MGIAEPLRRRAIHRLERYRTDWILDSGPGPGTSSRIMVEDGFQKISGLDPSQTLLQYAKIMLGPNFYPVRGVAESLPFRSDAFRGVLTCFSFRDVLDKSLSMEEFARVTKQEGRLEIVDIGKPDGTLRRMMVGLYITTLMPIIAKFFISGRTQGNPFRMIVPTFHRLGKNHSVTRLARQKFGSASLHEFLLGGLVIIEADRTSQSYGGSD